MNKRLRALLEKKQGLLAKARSINESATAADRDMTDAERTEFDALTAQVDALNGDIERERKLIAEEASMAAQDVSAVATTRASGGEAVAAQHANHGFRHFGEFAQAVRRGISPGARVDERLLIGASAPGNYANEGSGQDGGFLVPPEYSTAIWSHMINEESLIPLTDNNPISGNSMVYPKDETTPWGTDGVRAYWRKEAGDPTLTKPKIGPSNIMRLSELFALVPVTNELLEDGAALGAWLEPKAADSIRWKSNEALFYGDGVGQPKGFMNGGALVTVLKESGQAADTLVIANIAKMFARMATGSLSRAVWMINSDVLPQLLTMTLGNYPMFTPPGALPNAPAGALFGRPIVPSEHCTTLGDLGDIVFIDWKKYRTITKASGIQSDSSMHLYFDVNLMAFRFIFRIDGQPGLDVPVPVAKGSNTKSPFVVLEAR